jgi:alanyl-tRNA synthetase
MTSNEFRQSFLDFFASKGHTIVPSAPLLPSSPNLLFTNAGMNQFVPYFLGDRPAPYPRAADTQKCIRAGGKHNDLDDVGYDGYHHTLFEMLGNWSFGDYFKKEAIEWAWELLTEVWKFPKERLYVTVYQPGEGDPAEFDHEAHGYWSAVLQKAGLDPAKHILTGGKKDNFWMMGDTGPCGPCSEVHIDLTEKGDSEGRLVNADSPHCIEIWNLVFIQFNAGPDGTFAPLKAKHVDTGMGFERVAGIWATTEGFSRYGEATSNYNADVFAPIFEKIAALSGHSYRRSLPESRKNLDAAAMRDVAFRVLADHIRTLSCSIADGILPGNEGRNYVLRRILRRAVMYGRRLDLPAGFFSELVAPTVASLGHVFPELRERETVIRKVIAGEEAAFDRTIDRGLAILHRLFDSGATAISGEQAFELYDTYGFPLDLTEIIAGEKGLAVDKAGFEAHMEAQRERARAAQKKEIIRVADDDDGQATPFVGFDRLSWSAPQRTRVLHVAASGDDHFLTLERTPFYAEMGGQLGDTGEIAFNGLILPVLDTVKDAAGRFLHKVGAPTKADFAWTELEGAEVDASVAIDRRLAIQRHHSATHILHWALRKVLGTHVRQAGSYVGPDRLRFDFAHYEAVSAEQLAEIERLCTEKILANDPVRWFEVPFDEKPADVLAFFGEKYGSVVRVVDMGGWSKELCGGTHVDATGEIGQLKIVAESAIAGGTRRIEALAGEAARQWTDQRLRILETIAGGFSVRAEEVPQRVDDLRERLQQSERERKRLLAEAAAGRAGDLAAQAREVAGLKILATLLPVDSPNALREQGAKLLKELGEGVLVVGTSAEGKASLAAFASPAAIAAGHKAGDIIRDLTGQLGGRGGGKPDFAMGGGPDNGKLADLLAAWQSAFAS